MTRRRGKERKHVTCAGCIVYRLVGAAPEVLLIKPFADNDAWGIPKGHMDPGESLVDCAIRETYEETGLVCMPERRLSPVDTVNPREYKRVYTFLARHMGDAEPDPVMKDEVADIKWWSILDLPSIHRYQVPLLEQAVEILSTMTRE